MSDIKDFFKDQTVFLTGGTGFLGKVLIEKLLRECDLKKIYMLVRPKKDKSSQDRLEDILRSACFQGLNGHTNKIHVMTGNCAEPDLALGQEDLDLLKAEATIIIHAAADIKFDQTLKMAAYSNVRPTMEIVKLAKEVEGLKAMVYVSTAYSNCTCSHIKEEFYKPTLTGAQLFSILSCLDDFIIEGLTPKLLNGAPNTYVFTKRISENEIREEMGNLPLAIVRPAIVTTSAKEPLPGWIDNFSGIFAVCTGAYSGVIRSINGRGDCNVNLVPVDYVANIIIASAWNAHKESMFVDNLKLANQIRIYNFAGTKNNPITWGKFYELMAKSWYYPSVNRPWYLSFTMIRNAQLNRIYSFLTHTVVGYITDFTLICRREKPQAVQDYRKVSQLLDVVSYFTSRQWEFDDGNTKELWNKLNENDRKLFCFNMDDINWPRYVLDFALGIRIYLLKGNRDAVPELRRRALFITSVYYLVLAFSYLSILTSPLLVYKLIRTN